MTDPVPSKDVSTPRTDAVASDGWDSDAVAVPVVVSRQIERELREAEAELERRQAKIMQLQTALRGIQSCSTCSACRGAAERALSGIEPAGDTPRTDAAKGAWEYMGDRWVLASFAQQLEREVNQLKRYIARTAVEGGRTVAGSDIRALVESAYKDGYGGDLTDDRDLSARTLEMMRRMSQEPGISAGRAFELGWRTAANWVDRDDLIADIGSPAYELDKDKALGVTIKLATAPFWDTIVGANAIDCDSDELRVTMSFCRREDFDRAIAHIGAPPPPEDDPRPLWLNDRCQSEGCINPPVDGLFCAKHPEGGQG